MSLLIKSGHIVDPKNKIDEDMDLLIEKGKIAKLAKNIRVDSIKTLDAKGKIVVPGLIDMHVHLREPGREDEETIETGSKAAAKGGFTTIIAMPNTNPPCDNQGIVGFILSEASRVGLVNVLPVGTITKGREGKVLSEMGELKRSGVVALSDDGSSIESSGLMRRALEYASMFNLLVILHCEDKSLSSDGVIREGSVSTLLGMRGIPAISESVRVARDIRIAEMLKAKIHIAHVSTKESLEIIKQAKAKGVKVTCETCPHYFTLTDEAVRSFDTNTKTNPPLGTKEDLEAIKKGLSEGVIDCVVTDHAPHAEEEKDTDFVSAPFGIIGLETALGLAITYLLDEGVLSLSELIEKLSLNPAKILNLKTGSLSVGEEAHITVFDLEREWTVEADGFESKSKNSPFIGWKLKGKVEYTIFGGKIVYRDTNSC